MFYKSQVICLSAFLLSGALWGQVIDTVAYPSRPLPPAFIPWERGGSEFRQMGAPPLPPIAPHRIIGNVYFVGNSTFALYLVTSEQGHILFDPGHLRGVPDLQKAVEQLGFRFQDIKILLITHAHADHSEGAALVKQLTGAKLMVMEGDVETVETGGVPEAPGPMPPAKVDRVLHDKDEIRLGNNVITAYRTPGHSKGSTTYLWKAEENGKSYTVNLTTSLSVNDARYLVSGNAPELVEDYMRTFRILKTLPCDVWLADHTAFCFFNQKYAKLGKGGPNPYIDPEGYRKFIAFNEASFYYKLDWANRWSKE